LTVNDYKEDTEEIVETKGKIINLYYDLHIWNSTSPKLGGEMEIERVQERIQSIVGFESNALKDKGITFFSFKEGDISEDIDDDNLFHSRCRMHLKALWKKEFRFEVMNEVIAHGEIKEG